jgi:ABC-type thiamin/hydroxymethylpyrimidine transport system permease subunit
MQQRKETKINPEKLAMVKDLLGANNQVSLRDQFALAVVSSGIYHGVGYEVIARHVYELADTLMEMREQHANDEEE